MQNNVTTKNMGSLLTCCPLQRLKKNTYGIVSKIMEDIVSQLSNESKDNADGETFQATPGVLTTYILKDSLPI